MPPEDAHYSTTRLDYPARAYTIYKTTHKYQQASRLDYLVRPVGRAGLEELRVKVEYIYIYIFYKPNEG